MVHEIRGRGKEAVSEDETGLRMVLRGKMDSLGRNGRKGRANREVRSTAPDEKGSEISITIEDD